MSEWYWVILLAVAGVAFLLGRFDGARLVEKEWVKSIDKFPELHPDCRGPWEKGMTSYPTGEHIRDCDKCQEWNRTSDIKCIHGVDLRKEYCDQGQCLTWQKKHVPHLVPKAHGGTR